MDLEVELDRFLKIKTNGRDDSKSNQINYPYEATPYVALQALSNSGYIRKKDFVIDYGSGKGRVVFYLSYSTKANVIGVEYDPRLYQAALKNKETALSSNRVTFYNINASEFEIPNEVTCLYFFNPFSVEILDGVMEQLKKSKKNNDREVKLMFYYPSKEYIEYIKNIEGIIHLEDISLIDSFKEYDEREYISIYKI